MKLIKIFFILSILIVSSCSSKEFTRIISGNFNDQNKQYIFGSSDIPLFNGLELVEEDGTNFDTMLGDIVISKYIGDFELKLVKDFYLETLPQLGWILVDNENGKISFKREKDKLEIRFNYASKGLYVRFFILSVL